MFHRTIRFRLPAGRSAAALGAALSVAAAGTAALGPAAQAAPAAPYGGGTSTATVLRADLDASLPGGAARVPLHAALNDVQAPADARQTALTVTVGHGVEAGRPVDLLRAEAATAVATADAHRAQGTANVVHARVHLPGLPLLALVTADALTSRATCQAGRRPAASSHVAGLTVLGRRVALSATGATTVAVPGVGTVRLAVTETATTSRTAAATALHLGVRVAPAALGVAAVSGDVTLAAATCRTPQPGGTTGGTTGGSSGGATGGSSGGATGGSSNGTTAGSGNGGATNGASSGATGGVAGAGSGSRPQAVPGGADLAETGAGSATPYLAIGATGFLAAGAATVLLTSRRRKAARVAGGSEG